MRLKRPYVASLDQVRISREDGEAVIEIEYFDQGDQWTPRGDVLRCMISDGDPDNEPMIHIDDRDLSWKAFGRLLTTYAGWGMRVIFVPEDQTQVEPIIKVREPRQDER
jgi:hypothetical protein